MKRSSAHETIRCRLLVSIFMIISLLHSEGSGRGGSSNFLVVASVTDGVCDLSCPTDIGAVCAFGESASLATTTTTEGSAISATTTSINGMHCTCPSLYTGTLCEVPYQSCGDGQHNCLHGGTCVLGEEDDFGNVQLYCDCSTAVDSVSSTPYVGKYCQHATLTIDTQCTEANVATFCRNGGLCNDKYPVYGDSPCLCSGGHTGPRCEYTNGDYSTVVAANELSVATTGSTTSGSGTNDNDISDIDNSATTSSGGAGGGCSLNCRHGTCVVGQQDLTNEYQFWENPSTTEHCNCPDDWDGPFCEIPRVQCGDNHCFYGATCLEDVVDGKSLHHCDCNTAATATDSYAGRFCQYPATIYCTKDSTQNGHLFCTNNGTCREQSYEGCDCPDGFTGFSCEFRTSAAGAIDTSGAGITNLDPETSANCDLECKNGGTCRSGTQSVGHGLDLLGGMTEHSYNVGGTINMKHCVCPPEWTGTYCEEVGGDCPDNQFACPRSSKCVVDPQLCDCGQTNSGLATFFAGSNCEHPINDICLENAPSTSGDSIALSNIMPGAPLYFCLNGGICKEYVTYNDEGHPGCHCQDGWLGPHCELREASSVPNYNDRNSYNYGFSGESGHSGAAKALLTFLLVASLLVVACAIRLYRLRKSKRNNAVTSSVNWQPNYRDRPAAEVNIAPKRGSILDDVYEQAILPENRSSRDSISAHLAAAAAARSQPAPESEDDDLNDEGISDHDDTPQVDMGPPLDDDGHILHNVSIV